MRRSTLGEIVRLSGPGGGGGVEGVVVAGSRGSPTITQIFTSASQQTVLSVVKSGQIARQLTAIILLGDEYLQ